MIYFFLFIIKFIVLGLKSYLRHFFIECFAIIILSFEEFLEFSYYNEGDVLALALELFPLYFFLYFPI